MIYLSYNMKKQNSLVISPERGGFMQNPEQMKKLIDVSSGRVPADLVLKSARYLNVFTNEICAGDIAISDGYIAGIGKYEGLREEYIAEGVLVPGLMDAHIHLESSMVTPIEFAKAVIPHGTTTVITDPHEIANVLGTDGIRYMLEAAENLPIDVRIMLSSCVPAALMEDSNAELTAEDLEPLYADTRVSGLAEMMRYMSVVDGDEDILNKILSASSKGLPVDGHAPGLTGRELNAYAAASVASDHECSSLDEAVEKIRLGQYIMIREGTAAHNLHALWPLLNTSYADRCLMCTDDRHPNELLSLGHMDHNIRLAIREGADPIAAVKAATYNTAMYFGLHDRGAVAPGRLADLVLVDSLSDFHVLSVFKAGKRQSDADGFLLKIEKSSAASELDAKAHKTIRLPHLTPEMFITETSGTCGSELPVIGMIGGELLTTRYGTASRADTAKDILKIAVIESHKGSGRIGIGYIHGYGLKRGAAATSISHDAHNIIVAGADEISMAAAVNCLREMGGGIAVADGERIEASVPLPIAGLMSDLPLEETNILLEKAKETAFSMGVSHQIDPFMTLSFMSLSVIPEIRITTRGVYDVLAQKLV